MSQWNPDKIRLDVARDLREILKLYGDLRVEAIHHAADQLMPGGESMVMLGPVADSEAWSYAEISAALGRTEAHGLDDFDTDPEPPLLVLAGWEDCIRAELGTQTNKRASIEGAVKFIGSSVDWALDSNEDGEINFLEIDAMAHSIHTVRMRLENVLKDGVRHEQTETPCDNEDCTRPNLVKLYGQAVAFDKYQCPNCRSEFNYPEYVSARKKHMYSEAADNAWIDISAAAKSIGRSQFTIRQWMKVQDKGPRPRMPRVRYLPPQQMCPTQVLWRDVREQDRDTKRRQVMKGIAS